MLSVYSISSLAGYFLIMIILVIIAIILAKHKTAAWVVYGIGVGLQLLSLFGMQKKYSVFGFSVPGSYWLTFFVIAAAGALVIVLRRKKL